MKNRSILIFLLFSIILINTILVRCEDAENIVKELDNIIDILQTTNTEKLNTDQKQPSKKSVKNKIKYQVDISEGIITDTEDKEDTITVNPTNDKNQETQEINDKIQDSLIINNKKSYYKKPRNENDYEKVSMVNHEGTKFECYIPKPKPSGSEGWVDLPTVDEISELFEALDDICVNKNMGWWTYQFCFNKYLRQFHLEKGDHITAEFYLGKVPYKNNKGEIKGIDKEFIEAYNKKEILELPDSNQVPYYMEVFTDGTQCDLLNTKRQTEIKYYCSPDQSKSHYIQEIIEPSSCTYVIKIYTPFICALHPLFIPKEDTILNIQCVPQ